MAFETKVISTYREGDSRSACLTGGEFESVANHYFEDIATRGGKIVTQSIVRLQAAYPANTDPNLGLVDTALYVAQFDNPSSNKPAICRAHVISPYGFGDMELDEKPLDQFAHEVNQMYEEIHRLEGTVLACDSINLDTTIELGRFASIGGIGPQPHMLLLAELPADAGM